jgi:hypothetical protein
MIWLLLPSPPLSLSPEQIVSLSQFSCVSLIKLTDGRGGERGWCGRSQIMEEGKDEEAKIRNPRAYVAGLNIAAWWDQQEEELASTKQTHRGDGGGRRQVNKTFPLELNFSYMPAPNNTYDGEKAWSPINNSILSSPLFPRGIKGLWRQSIDDCLTSRCLHGLYSIKHMFVISCWK